MELTEVTTGLEALSKSRDIDFLSKATLLEQLQEIAKARGNRPVSLEELKKLRLDLRLLPALTQSNQKNLCDTRSPHNKL